LFLLLGVVLAVVAAVGVLMLSGGGGGGNQGGRVTPKPTEVDVVTAAVELPLGHVVTDADLGTTKVAEAQVPINAVTNKQTVVGSIVRQATSQGEVLTRDVFTVGSSAQGDAVQKALASGLRAMSVQVDQVTGVGTLIQPGDRVDVIITMSESDAKNPIVSEQAPTRGGEPPVPVRNFKTIDELLNNTTVKVLVQNVPVLGTLLPPPPERQGQQAPAASPGGGTTPDSEGTSLTGQQQIAILGLLPQQVELVRFAQIDGNLSLVLRDTEDNEAPPDETTGITLRELYDTYGILPPNIILTEVP
jgi:Flp pilus assembly protein CpaB